MGVDNLARRANGAGYVLDVTAKFHVSTIQGRLTPLSSVGFKRVSS
jgi:hypothetical protein